MLRKKDYEAELAKTVGELRTRKDHTKDELNIIGKNMPIRVMKSPELLGRYCYEKDMSLTDSSIILAWMIALFPFLDDVKVTGDVSYDDACMYYEQARVNTIVLHRVNYILHESISIVLDLLKDDKRVRFKAKKAFKDVEKKWDSYIIAHKKGIDDASWYTMLHHMGIVSDMVSPLMEKVYESLRDNMIHRGMRDVELKARIAVVFLMGKVAGHSFMHFFEDIEKECGIDFSRCFSHDNLEGMVDSFADMCNAIGIIAEKDDNGYWMLEGFSPDDSLRFKWAWKDFMEAMRDDDLMDEAARKAIDLNPTVREEYNKVIARQEEREMSESISKLSDKFKVKAV